MARKALSGVAFKSGKNKGKHKTGVCVGLNSSGKNKGKLKKGYKWAGDACPTKVGSSSSSSAKPQSRGKACKGLNAKGKLKKGFKFPGGGKCPVKA